MNEPFPFLLKRPRAKSTASGVALVLVLAVIVAASMLIVSYLSLTREQSLTSSSYNQTIQSSNVLDSAMLLIEQELQQEIRLGSTVSTQEGRDFFHPKTDLPLFARPARIVTPQEKLHFGNLVRRSARSAFQAANPASDLGGYDRNPFTLLASDVSTADAPRNGGSITRERWNKPVMLNGTVLNEFTLPDWVLLTRDGPLVFQNYTQATNLKGESVTADPGNSDPVNRSFVTGRFSFVVYNCDNGLDVNASGAPAVGFPSEAAHVQQRQRILPFADLTRLPMGTLTNSEKGNLIQALVGFRNHSTAANPYNISDPSDPSSFYGWATNAKHGYLRPAPGDQRTITRQELLRLWKSLNGPDETLPYLTSFTRDLNSPTYAPDPARPKVDGTDDANNPPFWSLTFPIAATIPQDATLAADLVLHPGDPLIPRRFALSRLKWLTKTGPSALNGGDPAGTVANIQRYFGLTWDGNRWIYDHGSANEILKLEDLRARIASNATGAREPDFFELLKAALRYGSLGLELNYLTSQPAVAAESTNTDLQIFKIAANIIDQGDTDGYPTTIAYANGQTDSSLYPEAHGIEDLPYLHKIYHLFLRQPSTPTRLNAYMLPEVWRPGFVAGPSNGDRPTQFRVIVQPDSSLQVSTRYSSALSPQAPETNAKPNPYTTGSNGPIRMFDTAASESSAVEFSVPMSDGDLVSQPRILLDSNSTTFASTNKVQNTIYSNLFPSGSHNRWNLIYLNYASIPATTTWVWRSSLVNYTISLALQYRDGNAGPWRTYTEWKAISSGQPYAISSEGTSPDTHTFEERYHFFKMDPRTERMGADSSWNGISGWSNDGKGVENRTVGHPAYKGAKSGFTSMSGFGSYNAGRWRPWWDNTGPITWNTANQGSWQRATDFAINREKPGKLNWYRDPDTVVRAGDAYYAVNSSGEDSAKLGCPISDTPNFASRPVLLNRPFRSVAELGYVYRDMPWRSLDFFSSNSADAALLDIFSIDETPPMRAGVVNLNTAFPETLQALLSVNQGSGSIPLHELGTAGTPTATDTLTTTEITTLARAFVEKTQASPLLNKSEVVTKLMEDEAAGSLSASYADASTRLIKARRETFVRTLGDNVQSRTWNLLIDIVAQSGRYRKNGSNLASDFIKEGERRVWWHLAIDRYTGKIVDQQIEPIYE